MTATTTNQPGQDPSTTIGVGGATSGQAGATPSHETQQETGGSGGEQLTASQGELAPETRSTTPSATPAATEANSEGPPAAPRDPAQPRDSSMHTKARGALDTRGEQAGGTGTGLGSPESGANQSPADLAPPARDQR